MIFRAMDFIHFIRSLLFFIHLFIHIHIYVRVCFIHLYQHPIFEQILFRICEYDALGNGNTKYDYDMH